MGCDIHAIVQIKKNGYWITVGGEDLGRNYVLFSVLANVRNGHGFAGVKTYDSIPFIDEPRGFPEDLELEEDGESVYGINRYRDNLEFNYWLGDHSHSYLTFSEIESYDWEQSMLSCGYVSPEQDKSLKENEQPSDWCGWTSQADWILRQWSTPIKSRINEDFFWMITAYKQHFDLNDVRLVFGFDS